MTFQRTCYYVLPEYFYIKISVRSRLFVPEANSVHQLMHDGPFVVAAFTKWKLLPNSCHPVLATNRGPAAKNQVTLNGNPLLSPLGGGGLFISITFEVKGGEVFIETGSLFNLAKTIVISSPERTRIQSRKAQVREVGGHTDLLWSSRTNNKSEVPVGKYTILDRFLKQGPACKIEGPDPNEGSNQQQVKI